MCQQVRWMKNREWVHKRECTVGNWPLFKKEKEEGKKGKEIYILKRININSLSLKYAPPHHEPKAEGKVALATARTFRKDKAPIVRLLTPTWLHISAPARSGRLGRSKRGQGPSPGGVTASCHTACSIATTRWHFHKMALLNYAAQQKGKERKGGGKLIFWVSASDLKPPLVFISAFCSLCKMACGAMGEQSSRPTAPVLHATGTSVSPFLKCNDSVTSTLAPIFPKLIPIWPSNAGRPEGQAGGNWHSQVHGFCLCSNAEPGPFTADDKQTQFAYTTWFGSPAWVTAQQPVVLWHFSRGHSSKDRLRCQVARRCRWQLEVVCPGELIPPWPHRSFLLLIHPPRPLHNAHATPLNYSSVINVA